jgi:RNA polymerase sigma-70 factor (ECF subfamily)
MQTECLGVRIDGAAPAQAQTFGDGLVSVYPGLLSYARRFTRSAADAEDLVHDAIERGLLRQHLLRDGRLEPWIGTILRHIFLDGYRRRQSWKAIGVELAHLMRADTEVDDPLDEVDMVDLRASRLAPRSYGTDDVRSAMTDLSPKMKEVFALFVFDRLSQREIGRRLGLPISTVGTRLLRARRQLRLVLEAGSRRGRGRASIAGGQRPKPGRPARDRGERITPSVSGRASR